MVIQHNLMAMNSMRSLGIVVNNQSKKTEKLSSGYRINRAADDAAGLAISEKMRWMIRGLSQGTENTQDGISYVQIGDGAMSEIHDMLHRMEELAVKGANGTLMDDDRGMIDKEVQQLKQQINEISKHTVFNELQIFDNKSSLFVSGTPNDMFFLMRVTTRLPVNTPMAVFCFRDKESNGRTWILIWWIRQRDCLPGAHTSTVWVQQPTTFIRKRTERCRTASHVRCR